MNEYSDENYNVYRANGARDVQSIQSEVVSKSFIFMFVALLLTGAAAYYALNSNLIIRLLFSRYAFFALLIGEFVIVLAANACMSKNLVVPSVALFTAYSIINGLTLSVVFLLYTKQSVFAVFFLTAVMFGVMAVIGLVTKKDLTRIGSLCLMGLIGIILAGVVNMFLQSSSFDLMISVLGVLIFVGLTAYDTQKIKQRAAVAGEETVITLALFGAMQLYLDFINLFLKLLRILGKRR